MPSEIGLILHELGVFPRIQAGIEGFRIQFHVSSEAFQVILAESSLILAILMAEEIVMKFPESILITRTFSSFGCPKRFITQKRKVEITKAYFSRFNICCINLTTRVSGKLPAVGSLIIAKFDHCDRGVGVTFEMCNLAGEVSRKLLLAVDGR